MSLVASMGLAELLVRLSHVENVIDDLEQHAQLVCKTPVGHSLTFGQSFELEHDTDADGDKLTVTQVNGQPITAGGAAVTIVVGGVTEGTVKSATSRGIAAITRMLKGDS